MKKRFLCGILILAASTLLFSYDLPQGWYKAGSDPEKYDMGVDKGAGRKGKNVATIKSTENNIKGFGTLMQTTLPGEYLGKRVRMTGYMKSADVDNRAGFWLRVDGPETGKPLSFDNMYERPIKGTTDWKQYEIVLDVPSNATDIAFGALLTGTGQIWFDDIKFEILSDAIKTTGSNVRTLPSKPQNLNFEQ